MSLITNVFCTEGAPLGEKRYGVKLKRLCKFNSQKRSRILRNILLFLFSLSLATSKSFGFLQGGGVGVESTLNKIF